MTLFPRSSGVLLHPTSLPGRYGVGDLGDWAYRFVDWLVSAGQSIWQVLPLGPTSYGDSPYQALSTFAGNTNLISFDLLVKDGWLSKADLLDAPDFPAGRVDYGWIIMYHAEKLGLAYERFSADKSAHAAFAAWCATQPWLEDFALFVALKNANNGRPWVEWDDAGEALRKPKALDAAAKKYARQVEAQKFYQWVFFRQWDALKAYANGNGVRIVGDIPIFVAHDSADVWVHRDLFHLDEKGAPLVIAGVPPDYFSPTGQRWGNPLYDWEANQQQGYVWWIERIRATLAVVDYVRIDHFRGFDAYWEVPASEETAINGKWVEGPGIDLFRAVQAALGDDLPIIAEDLGLITRSVRKLRDDLGLPGMKILQFAFGGECGTNDFLPHHYTPNCVCYTGTHDNNTALGWWMQEADAPKKECFRQYVGSEITQPHWEMIRLGMASVAHTFVMPMQDIFGLGADARMNTPGAPAGNWGWRLSADALDSSAKNTLLYLTRLYSRLPKTGDADDDEPRDAAMG